MKDNKEAKISYWAAHLTTVVSVSLVLVIVGVIAMMSLAAARETTRLKERLELSVVLADSVSDQGAGRFFMLIRKQPYALDTRLITRQQALENWQRETGENLESTFGINPLSPEVAFRVAADYASPKSIEAIREKLAAMPGVEDVAAPDASMVQSMNANIEKLSIGLGIVALVLLVISFVLINNTVQLSIHSRRFTIHTMQLVGATDGFIRRPFITDNLWCGIVSGLCASALIALTMAALPNAGIPEMEKAADWGEFGIIAGGLVVTGALLCVLAAALATTRYLHRDYGQLIRN